MLTRCNNCFFVGLLDAFVYRQSSGESSFVLAYYDTRLYRLHVNARSQSIEHAHWLGSITQWAAATSSLRVYRTLAYIIHVTTGVISPQKYVLPPYLSFV